jgi:2-polyprenyl-6-methoxyphenol hydroxylase-like FAD-dependent oxidoreductase
VAACCCIATANVCLQALGFYGVKTANSETEVSFANGRTAARTVVIGADGVHSEIRNSAGLPSAIRRPGAAYLRGISFAKPSHREIHELWSLTGRRFGYAPLPAQETYFYCSAPLGHWPIRDPNAFTRWKNSWSEFGPVARNVVEEVTDWSAANYSEVIEIETKRWSKPPVFLVGLRTA